MNKASFARIALIGVVVLAIFASIIGYVGLVNAQTSTTLDSTLCNMLYGLPAGTISTSIASEYLNPTVCAAMNDLISRYVNTTSGVCPSSAFTNPKVQAITSLNSTFAVNLDNMLKAADAANYHITIISAFRSVACEHSINPNGFGGNSSLSLHTKGQAADLVFPNEPNGNSKGDCDIGILSKAYLWVNQNDKTYNLGQYDQVMPHVNGECNHVQALYGTTDSTMGPGNPNGSSVPVAAQPPYTGIAPLGAPASPGQIMTQNTQCQLSNGTVITIPAGSAYPQGCINNGAPVSNGLQASCIGNAIAYNLGGSLTTGQTCPAGCFNGACIPTSCPAGSTLTNGICSQQQQQCAAGYTSQNGVCTPQQCPSGYTMSNGLCNQTQTQQQAAAQPASTAAAPASSATAPASTANAPAGTTGTTGTSGSAQAAPVTLASPTLLPNLGTSTLGVLQAMANNPQTSAAPPVPAPTPITLNSSDQQISQLQANAPPGVTYAEPTSDLFPGSGQSGTGASGSGGGSGNGNGITTTSGTGYSLTNGNGSASANSAPPAGTATDVQSQNGVSTFTSGDLSGSGVTPAAPTSFVSAPSTFVSDTLSILAGLKSELIGALGFLATYAQPFGGNVPSQQGGE